MIHIEKATLEIGLGKPLKILHMTDSHLPFYCESDPESIIRHGQKRDREKYVRHFEELLQYGGEHCDLIVHTGDLIDSISKPCVAFVKAFLPRERFLCVAGNHEYAKYDGLKEDMAYRLRSMAEIGGYGVDLFHNACVAGGVNFVGIDDAYHQVEEEQLDFLKNEVKKGYPVVLFMHAPLYEKELYEKSYQFWKGEICVLGSDAAVHPEVNGDIAEPTAASKAFYEYVVHEPQIKAVLAGHLHFSFEKRFPGGAVQYVTSQGYEGNAREITLV